MWPVSNGEWLPAPPTKKQLAAERVVAEEADRIAKRHGMSRAQFLRTAAGTMLGFSVLNRIHGLDAWGDNAVLPVRREETEDLAAACERLSIKPYFIVDVQTHHIDTEQFPGVAICNLLRFADDKGALVCDDQEDAGRTAYIREMFLDSETHVSVISGLPSGVPCGPAAMAHTKDLVNEIAGSERCITQAMIDPGVTNSPLTAPDTLEHQVRDLGGRAIKCYSYNGHWRLDDEVKAYPMYEEAVRLGIKLVNCHKGLPGFGGPGANQSVRTIDIPKAVADWPQLRFCAYHSGYFPESSDPGLAHPEGKNGITEFVEILEAMPKKHRKRVYAEIGSTFPGAVLSDNANPGPMQGAHLIGQLMKTLGSKNILWGTDSIWWGSPQWIINAFKILQIPVSLQEQFGYPALREKDKRRIFGENAAKLYGIKRKDKKNLCPIPEDALTGLQVAKGGSYRNRSLKVHGSRSRREFVKLFGTPFA
jgi:predicted TIM-barrel fold metal-dependent hydrolase